VAQGFVGSLSWDVISYIMLCAPRSLTAPRTPRSAPEIPRAEMARNPFLSNLACSLGAVGLDAEAGPALETVRFNCATGPDGENEVPVWPTDKFWKNSEIAEMLKRKPAVPKAPSIFGGSFLVLTFFPISRLRRDPFSPRPTYKLESRPLHVGALSSILNFVTRRRSILPGGGGSDRFFFSFFFLFFFFFPFFFFFFFFFFFSHWCA
jgi:hypothetical protein